MKNNLYKKSNKNLILEFNGLPGSGKTTNSSVLEAELNKLEIPVVSYSDFLSNEGKNNILRLTKALLNVPFFITIKITLLGFSLKNNDKLWRILTCIYVFEKYILFNKEATGVLIVDQGIIQGIISLFHLNNHISRKQERNINSILSFMNKKNVIIVNSICEVGLVCERLSQRKHNGSRFHDMNSMELEKNLMIQNSLFDKIRNLIIQKNMSQININMESTPYDNYKFVLSRIMELL